MTRVSDYDRLVSEARRVPTSGWSVRSEETAAASIIASSIRGLMYAVLALAESGRPEPVRVDVKVNAAEVATKVSEQLGGGKKVGVREDVRQVNGLAAILAELPDGDVVSTGKVARALYEGGARIP
jgi:hypothetical protein